MARYRRSRGRRSYRGGFRGRRRSNGGMFGISMTTLMGLIAGYTDMDKQIPIPGDIQVGIATIPMRLPVKGLKGFFQGVVFGNVLQARMGRSGISRGGDSALGR